MTRPRILVLAGPSGAGKSRLARRLHAEHGWPVVQLDDFYRELGDPGLPMSPLGLPDWDDARSWNLPEALDALEQLCTTGRAEVPVYDIATSAVTGRAELESGGHPLVVAEGIFAAESIPGLLSRGLLAEAWCIRNSPWITFGRRLARDLSERRKPPVTLWRRGHILRRAEPGIVAAQAALGAVPMTVREAEERVTRLLAGAGRDEQGTTQGAGG